MTFVADIAYVALVIFVIAVAWKIVKPWIPYSQEWARRIDENIAKKPKEKPKPEE